MAIATLATAVATIAQGDVRLSETGRFLGEGGRFERIAFSPDGTHMISSGKYGDLIVWSTRSWRPTWRLPPAGDHFHAVALDSTNRLALVSSNRTEDGITEAIDLATGERTRLMDSESNTIAVAWDGRVALHCGQQVTLLASPTADRDPPTTHALPGAGAVHMFFRAGTTQLIATRKAGSRSYVLDSASPTARFAACKRQLAGFTSSGTRIQRRGMWLRWSDQTLRLDHKLGYTTSGDGDHLALLDSDSGRIRLVDDGGVLESSGHFSLGRAFAVSSRGVVAAPSHLGGCVVFDGREQRYLGGHAGRTSNLEFTPDGRYVAATGIYAAAVASVRGQVIERWHRRCSLITGSSGPEFMVIEPRRLRAWNAAGNTTLHESSLPADRCTPWLDHTLFGFGTETARIVASDPTLILLQGRPGRADQRLPTLWLDARTMAPRPLSQPDNRVWPTDRQPVGISVHERSGRIVIRHRASAASLRNTPFQPPHTGAIDVLDLRGRLLHRMETESVVLSASHGPDGKTLLVLDSLGPRILDANSFQVIAERDRPDLRWAAHVRDDLLLAHDGRRLIQMRLPEFDETPLAVPGPATIPALQGRIGAARVGPKRKRIALGIGPLVRVFEISRAKPSKVGK